MQVINREKLSMPHVKQTSGLKLQEKNCEKSLQATSAVVREFADPVQD